MNLATHRVSKTDVFSVLEIRRVKTILHTLWCKCFKIGSLLLIAAEDPSALCRASKTSNVVGGEHEVPFWRRPAPFRI